MVGLYKDPKGERIFDSDGAVTAAGTTIFENQTVEDLRKRVRELEAVIASKGVSGSVCVC